MTQDASHLKPNSLLLVIVVTKHIVLGPTAAATVAAGMT